jgi:hypothetical protein
MKKHIEIEELIKAFESSIDSQITKLTESPEKVRLGYDNAAITAQRQILSENLSHLNNIADLYLKIFEGKKKSLETIKEVLSLPFSLPPEETEFFLKEKYLNHIEYNYKLFGFRISAVVKLYDYPSGVESSIKAIISEASLLLKLENVVQHFDEKLGLFVVTEKDEQEIIEANTAYADADSLKDIVYTAVLVKAIKFMKELQPDYYFTELPELSWSAINKLEFDKSNIYSDQIGINLNHWVSSWISSKQTDYDISVIGVDERQSPLLKVNDKFYRAVHMSLRSVFKQNDIIEFRELSKLENREALIRLVVLDFTSNMGMLEEYTPGDGKYKTQKHTADGREPQPDGSFLTRI